MALSFDANDVRKLAKAELFVTFLFVVFPGNHTGDFVADYIRVMTGKQPQLAALEETLRGLLTLGVLEEGVGSRDTHTPAYRLAVTFTPKALSVISATATKGGLWPMDDWICKGAAGAWLGCELSFAVRNYVDPHQVWQVCETVRALLEGGPTGAFVQPPNARYVLLSVHWTAVTHLLNLLAPDAAPRPDDLDPQALTSLVPVLLEAAFLRGVDVRPLLESTRALMARRGARPPMSLLCTFCALTVWTVRRDLLTGLAPLIPQGSPAEFCATICLDVFEGRFAESEKAFYQHADSFRSIFPGEVSTPIGLLGIALAARADAMGSRGSRYARQLKSEPPDLINWHPVARAAFHEALIARSRLVDHVLRATAPVSRVGTVFSTDASDALLPARTAYLAGYPTLAAIIVQELTRGRANLPGLEDFQKILAESGAVALVGAVETEAAWRTALRELGECLPKHAAPEKIEQVLSGTIGWTLTLSTIYAHDGAELCVCERLQPFYRGPRGAATGADDQTLTLKALATAKYRPCLTASDLQVLHELQLKAYDPRKARSVPEGVFALLCGHPQLMVITSGIVIARDDAPRNVMTLEKRACEVTTAKQGTNDLALSVPLWLTATGEASYAIRRVAPGSYVYHELSKKVRTVAEIFRKFGDGGTITVPVEGLKTAMDLLERLAGVVDVSGDFATDASGTFTREAGDATPHVRLTFANEALSLSLVVVPLANRAVTACEPGTGQSERLVKLRGGNTVLLVRDLAAEKTRAEVVRAALAPFDKWATDKTNWHISQLEPALEALRALKELTDVRLEWPEGEKLHVAKPGAKGIRIEAMGQDWFDITGEVTLEDGRVLKLIELLRALANREGNFVRFGENDYLYLTKELQERFEAIREAAGPLSAEAVSAHVSAAAVPMLAQAFAGGEDDLPQLPELLATRAAEIRAAFATPTILPKNFKGELRAYQSEGFTWLAHVAACGFGACLADDMGLGKTIQVIALLLARAKDGASLVIAPASVCMNWVREIARFAPSLHVVTPGGDVHLPDAPRAKEVVVASYGLLVTHAQDFAAIAWNGVVLDEAQAVKNAATQRAQAARDLKAKFRVAATGTPVENHLGEFWSIFSFLNPGLLGPARSFEERFTEAGFAKASLKRLIEPFVLRRLKKDVLTELPEKTEVTLRVTLGADERAAYEACRLDAVASLKEKGAEANHISILAALTRLRRFCCHPSLVFPEQKASAKLDAVLELLGDLREAGHRALVFSQFTDYLKIVQDAIRAKGWSTLYLDGETPSAQRTKAVDAFQGGEGEFFLISLKAGGTGLNLTAANYVLLLDPWWNPAVEDQAADRAHRIGQREPVTVYRIVAADTVEERVLDLHGDKRAVSDDLLTAATGKKLTTDHLLKLFA